MSTSSHSRTRRRTPDSKPTVMFSPAHLPRALVRALYGHAPMLLASGHEALYASALLSPSLSSAEKARVLDQGPVLSQYQADELAVVFDDERREFDKLAHTEGPIVARLQALALWDGVELVRERLGIGDALRNAWLRRTVRQAARGGALATWLHITLPDAADWHAAGPIVRRIYRETLASDHPAWHARDDEAALAQATAAHRREQAAATLRKRQDAEQQARARAEQAAEASWTD